MSLQLVIDMNLSPEWVVEFGQQGWHAIGGGETSSGDFYPAAFFSFTRHL